MEGAFTAFLHKAHDNPRFISSVDKPHAVWYISFRLASEAPRKAIRPECSIHATSKRRRNAHTERSGNA
jgi:hypothetical protein